MAIPPPDINQNENGNLHQSPVITKAFGIGSITGMPRFLALFVFILLSAGAVLLAVVGDDTRLKGLVIIGLGLPIIILVFLYFYQKAKNPDKLEARLNEQKKLTIQVYHGENVTNVVSNAQIYISNVDKPDEGKTNKHGMWSYAYPAYYIEQNQAVYIRAEKEGIGVASKKVKLTGQNQPVLIDLTEVGSPKPIPNMAPSKSRFREPLIDLLIRSGLADMNRRKAFCIRIGADPNLLSVSPDNPTLSAVDFATLLISDLEKRKETDALRAMCQELQPVFEQTSYRVILEDICSQLPNKLNNLD